MLSQCRSNKVWTGLQRVEQHLIDIGSTFIICWAPIGLYIKKNIYRIFRCITRYFLFLERPGAGKITNAGYTLLKSEIARERFFITANCVFFFCTLLHRATWELAVDGHYTHTPLSQ